MARAYVVRVQLYTHSKLCFHLSILFGVKMMFRREARTFLTRYTNTKQDRHGAHQRSERHAQGENMPEVLLSRNLIDTSVFAFLEMKF